MELELFCTQYELISLIYCLVISILCLIFTLKLSVALEICCFRHCNHNDDPPLTRVITSSHLDHIPKLSRGDSHTNSHASARRPLTLETPRLPSTLNLTTKITNNNSSSTMMNNINIERRDTVNTAQNDQQQNRNSTTDTRDNPEHHQITNIVITETQDIQDIQDMQDAKDNVGDSVKHEQTSSNVTKIQLEGLRLQIIPPKSLDISNDTSNINHTDPAITTISTITTNTTNGSILKSGNERHSIHRQYRTRQDSESVNKINNSNYGNNIITGRLSTPSPLPRSTTPSITGPNGLNDSNGFNNGLTLQRSLTPTGQSGHMSGREDRGDSVLSTGDDLERSYGTNRSLSVGSTNDSNNNNSNNNYNKERYNNNHNRKYSRRDVDIIDIKRSNSNSNLYRRKSSNMGGNKKRRISRFFRISSMLTMIFLTLSVDCSALSWVVYCFIGNNHWSHVLFVLFYLVLYVFGVLMILVIFLKRLESTFRGTQYAYSRRVYLMFEIGIGMFIIFAMVISFFITFNVFDIFELVIWYVITIIMYGVLQVSLLSLFVLSIVKLAITMKDDSCNTQTGSSSKRFEDLVFIAVKYSFIVLVSVLASIITPLIIFALGARPSWVTATEMLITQICLYLQFGFANDMYMNICGRCHRFVSSKLIGAPLGLTKEGSLTRSHSSRSFTS